jgi:hypothetical protein
LPLFWKHSVDGSRSIIEEIEDAGNVLVRCSLPIPTVDSIRTFLSKAGTFGSYTQSYYFLPYIEASFHTIFSICDAYFCGFPATQNISVRVMWL